MNEIIPGINETEWSEIEKKLDVVLPFAKTIHIDLMDGEFVERKTFSNPQAFEKYTKRAEFEVHMMVDNPIQYLNEWAQAGFTRFIGHIEGMSDPTEFIAQAQLLGSVGIAVDGPSGLELLDKINLEDLDCILVMTIKAGASGQDFMPEMLEKVREIRKRNEFITIEVDGGINEKTITLAKEAGVNNFVSTSYLFKESEAGQNYERLKKLLE